MWEGGRTEAHRDRPVTAEGELQVGSTTAELGGAWHAGQEPRSECLCLENSQHGLQGQRDEVP